MKLSARLQAIADEIKPGETMADVGTDHGFLPVELMRNGVSPKAIMADVSDAALAKARRHGQRAGYGESALYRIGDGLNVLDPGESDVVVLAGMGAILMIDILSADPPKTASFARFILQPRNYPYLLRKWLQEQEYSLQKDFLVREGRRICEIMIASPSQPGKIFWPDPPWPQEDIRWEVPPWYGKAEEPVFREYIEHKLHREIRVRRELRRKKQSAEVLLQVRDVRIAYLESLLKGECHGQLD